MVSLHMTHEDQAANLSSALNDEHVRNMQTLRLNKNNEKDEKKSTARS